MCLSEHPLQGINFDFAAGPATQAFHEDERAVPGGESFFEKRLQVRQRPLSDHDAVAALEGIVGLSRLPHPGQAALDLGDHFIRHFGRAPAQVDDGPEAGGPADGGEVLPAIEAGEEVAAEERHRLAPAASGGADQGQVDLEPLGLEKAADLALLVRLGVEGVPVGHDSPGETGPDRFNRAADTGPPWESK